MNGGTKPMAGQTGERAGSGDPDTGLPVTRARRGWLTALVIAVVLVGVAAGVQLVQPYGISLAHPLGQRPVSAGQVASQVNDAGTSTAPVQRMTLSQTTSLNGTLSYTGDYTVLGHIAGTVTWLPSLGRVIEQGQVLYRVDGSPVVLLYGSIPAYRTLVAGATAAEMSGKDVAQLNHDLVALGYVHKADVNSAWNEFNWATIRGVERMQRHLGIDQTGELPLGEVVFLPTAARVTSVDATRGGPATGPILRASSTRHTVSVALSADLQSEVKTGDRVTITLPDGSITPGVVSSVGTVATLPSDSQDGGSPSGPTITVQITPTHAHATGSLDQAPVLVAITDRTVKGALAVPVSALLARSGARYAVEVVDPDGTHRLIPVTPGLYDDTQLLVQVTGAGLAAGQRVVVAGQ